MDLFSETWRAFSRHPLKRLSDFEGKRVGPLSVSKQGGIPRQQSFRASASESISNNYVDLNLKELEV